jgi:poly[(R)-3-hydroxyalkanoate] polymerase subunit PhaC
VAAVEELNYGFDLMGMDPGSLGSALVSAAVAVAKEPAKLAQATAGLAVEEGAVALDTARRLLDVEVESRVQHDKGDRRFTDRAWQENPFLRGLVESYLVGSRWALRLLDGADLDPRTARKARFALGVFLDTVAPANVPWLHPAVLKEAIDTGGLSVLRGGVNWLQDLVAGRGYPRQVDRSPFEVGHNLAATPGRVVFRNELIELLAYAPQTETVYAQPIVYSPPWINKYYVMDLAPGRSFIEFAVEHGFTVFAISYRNPDASMGELTLDDYLRDGFLTALEQASELTGSPTVNVEAVCIGGTLAMIGLAVLAARGEGGRVGWATLNNVLVDFTDPGDIAIFADEQAIERIERRNEKRGYHAAEDMAGAFTWMRGNDLVWSYVVSNWYMGKQPPAFDILAWNADSTRLPATMHSQYLRTCYLRNQLVESDRFTIDGTPVDVSKIATPLYVLSAERDHIAPWRSCYRTTKLVGSDDVRHVLSSGGHIAGMVNPPGSPKATYRVNDELPADAEEWLRGSELVQGSWWEDWAAWAAARSGKRVAPPELPEGEPAPGTYVRT